MSSYAHVFMAGREVASFRDGVEPTFMFLFRANELVRVVRSEKERPSLGYDVEEEYEACEFAVPARSLRDRLDVLGIGRDAAEDAFDEIVRARLEHCEHPPYPLPESLAEVYVDEAKILRNLNYDQWIAREREAAHASEKRPDRMAPGTASWLTALWDYHDPRWVLRAFVDAFPDETVVLDVTDLEAGGWLEPEMAPQQAAFENFSWAMANGAPPIVLAEGKSDIRVLEAAVAIRRPHLDGFLRFADFSFGAEGGASALVRTIRTFASAGVANRVIGIFDNDTAAADVLMSIKDKRLPPNILIMQYPDLGIAQKYPTLGPTGLAETNVNGVAGSIELYLEVDVLRDENGSLRPVQWTGYVSRLGCYQGELIGKRSLLERFEAKVADARVSAERVKDQDWSGIDAILDAIQERLSSPIRIWTERVS